MYVLILSAHWNFTKASYKILRSLHHLPYFLFIQRLILSALIYKINNTTKSEVNVIIH